MIKMVVSDLDGTLLTEGTDRLNPEYYEVIRELKKKGILFVAASGRQYASMRYVLEPVADDVIFASENGTNITKDGQDILNSYMDRTMAEEVIRYFRKMDDCEIMLCTPRTQYFERRNEKFLDWMLYGYHSSIEVVDDLLDYIDQANKVSVYREAGSRPIGDQVMEAFSDRLNVAVSGTVWIDIMNKETDKSAAVMYLQETLGITREETMVFGDNCNDLGMFSCGTETFAVENAHPDLIAAAKHIIPSVDKNGVLETLKEWLLK